MSTTATILAGMEKKFGKGVVHQGIGGLEPLQSIPTGSVGLDKASGIGGYPRGRIVEIFGPEHSGKTTLAIHAMAEVQKTGGRVAFIDVEHSLDFGYAQTIGVNTETLFISYPENGEQAFDVAEALIQTGEFDLIVLDSVAAIVPKAELEGDMSTQQMGLQARLIGKGIRKIVGRMHKTNTAFILINQLRMKIGVVFGNPETRPGGKSLDYAASMMLEIRKTGSIKGPEDTILGHNTKVKFTKNKCGGMPGALVEFDIMWGTGINYLAELLDEAVTKAVIEKAGAWYSYQGERMGQGRESALEYLRANQGARDSLIAALKA